MKKIISLMLIFMVCFTAFAGNTVKLYAPDGIAIEVSEDEVEKYLGYGYGKTPDDVKTTLYSVDGRSVKVYNSNVDSYKKVGWYSYEDATIKLYKTDGTVTRVFKGEVEKYKAEGWYPYDEATIKLYTPQGRSLVIFKDQEETYLALGWFRYEDATVSLYTDTGRKLTIFKCEEETYLNLGWIHYEDATTTLYTEAGKSLTIFNCEKDTYLNLGWLNYEDATTTLYSTDGKTLTVFKGEVEKYKELGWKVKRVPDPTKPMIAFTFDDGPNPTHTISVINTLVAYDSSATFFMLGRLAASYPDVVKYAVANNMEIGNHSYNHANLANLSAYGVSNDVNSASSSIYNAGNVYPKLLRPPYGSVSSTLKYNAGLPLILWSVDTLDWQSRNAYSVYNHILANVKDGDIVLMHDIYSSTAEAVKMVVPELIKRGFQIVSVSELAEAKGYKMTSGNSYSQFR